MGPKFSNFLFLLLSFSLIANLCSADAENLSAQKAQEQTDKITNSVLSPFCPGRLLYDCPSSSATKLKSNIYKQLLNGETPEAILNQLYLTYGEEIRAAPTFSSFGLVAWLAPFIFLLVGGLSIFLWIHSTLKKNINKKNINI